MKDDRGQAEDRRSHWSTGRVQMNDGKDLNLDNVRMNEQKEKVLS